MLHEEKLVAWVDVIAGKAIEFFDDIDRHIVPLADLPEGIAGLDDVDDHSG